MITKQICIWAIDNLYNKNNTKLLKLVRAIISGEHPEAMQTGSSGCRYSWLNISLLICILLCYNNQVLTLNVSSLSTKPAIVTTRRISVSNTTMNTTTTIASKRTKGHQPSISHFTNNILKSSSKISSTSSHINYISSKTTNCYSNIRWWTE